MNIMKQIHSRTDMSNEAHKKGRKGKKIGRYDNRRYG
jgi:hypothetical protein